MSVASAGLLQTVQTLQAPQAPPASFNPALNTPHAASLRGRLRVRWAGTEEDLRAVQRLRHQVFADEMGARLSPPPGTPPGLDADRFDAFCDHLMVSVWGDDQDDDDGPPGLLVGTYRVLPPEAARRAGGLYADTEFDLAPLQALRPHAVELGRACVHPHWRSGSVIMSLWEALGRYMAVRQLQTMIGCASISLADGGHGARQLWRALRRQHLADAPWQVLPRQPLSLAGDVVAEGAGHALELAADLALADIPPLIRGYLRCGTRLLGPPALDGAFNTADLPMMLRVQEMTPRYRRHFITSHLCV